MACSRSSLPTRIRSGVRIGATFASTTAASGFGASRSGRLAPAGRCMPRNQIGAGAPSTAACSVGAFETRNITRFPPRLTP